MNKNIKLCLALLLALVVLVQYSFSPQAIIAYGLDNTDSAAQTVEAKESEPATEAPKATEPATEAPKATEPATEAPKTSDQGGNADSSDAEESNDNSDGSDADATEADNQQMDAEQTEEVEEEADDEEKYPAVSFTKSAGGVTVNISAPEGALPEGATVKVTAVSAGSVENAVEQLMGESEVVKAVDITFHDKDGKEIEPKKNVSVTFTSNAFVGLNDARVVHIKDNGAAENVGGSSVSGSKATFKSDDFSIYVIVEGDPDPDARLFVNFHNADGSSIATMSMTLNQLNAGQMNTNIYDPGVKLESGDVFKGWIDKADFDVDDAEDGLDIAGVRNMVSSELGTNTVKDGDTIDLYAMVFKAYHVSYRDELAVTIHTDEVLYKAGAESIPYTFQFAYTPYYVTGSDEDDETKAANFDGWKQLDPEVTHPPVYNNGDSVDLSDFDLSGSNRTLTVKAQVAYGHWLVFNENGSGASYTEPLFVAVEKTPETAGMPSAPNRPGYSFGGWYTDAACTAGTEFDSTKPITQTTNVWAKWNENAKADFTVLIWEESLDGGYDFVKSINIEDVDTGYVMSNAITGNVGASTIKVNGQNVFIPFADDKNTACEGFTYKECKANSEDGKVKADGTSVLNVYFDRRTYTLKFYYGAQTGGNQWRIAHNNNNSAYTWGSPSGFTPEYTGSLSKGTDGTGEGKVNNGTYYYASITAKYGADISSKWPKYADFKQGNSDQNYFNSWILMPGAKARTGQYGGNITVKGKITTMDEQLLGNLKSENGNYLVAQYNTRPNYYTYYIYLKNYENANTRTYKDNSYGLYEKIDVRSGSDYSNQHAPSYRGYEEVHAENNGVTAREGREIYYFYDPLSYPILFMDGLYENGDHTVIKNNSSNTLRSLQDEYAIEFSSDVSEYNKYDPSDKISDGEKYVFLGWYSDDKCTQKYTFGKMPIDGIKVYAKWVLKEYKVTLHPQTDGDESFRYVNGNTEGHYGTNGDVIYVNNGEKLGNVGGTRELYDLIGWFARANLSKVWDFDAFTLNDTIVSKYGKLYSASEIDPKYPGTVGEVNLYASWRRILDGADGIDVVYTAIGKDDKGNTIKGTGAPTDNNEYSDQAQAIAKPACQAPVAPEGETQLAFQHWVVQKWDADSKEYVDTDQTVLPGDRFTVNYDDAREMDIPEDQQSDDPNAPTKSYTVQLRAHYGSAEDATPTHIYWYNNYTNGEAGILHKDDDLAINQKVNVQSAPAREGYDFIGWAKKPETNDKGERIYTYDNLGENDVYVKYSNGAYTYKDKSGNEKAATGVFADENTPYQGMYAVWNAKDVNYKVEFYYQNEDGTGYTKDDTLTATRQAKTGSTVSATDADKAQTKNGKYALNESESTLSAKVKGNGSTVLKLYFDLSKVNVTVNHYLYGQTEAFKTDTVTDQQLGGEYTAKPETEYKGKTLNVKNYDPSQTITVKASGNVINVYYTIPLTITAETKSKSYDGTPLNGEYTVTGALTDDIVTINTALGTAPSITYVSVKNYLTESEQAAITGIPGYYTVTYVPGTLTITQNAAAITVVPGSGSKVYDGTALTKTAHADFAVNGVPTGFTWTAAADGTVTNVTPGAGEKAVNAVTEFKIFDKDGKDVTNQFSNITKSATGTLTITARLITLKANNASDVYTGSKITYATAGDAVAPYYQITNTAEGEGLVDGQSITAIALTGEGVKAGNYPITITEGSVAIGGNTANYAITLLPGTLTIKQNESEIVVVPGSGSKVYDGTPLTKTAHGDFTVTGVPEGFTWTAKADGTVTNVTPGAGEKAENAVTEFKIFDASGADVTDQFKNINTEATGTLTITARSITITANNANKKYDGSALTESGFKAEGLAGSDAHKFTVAMTADSTITDAGTKPNVIAEVDGVEVTAGAAAAVGNYLITAADGTLTVTKRDVVITSASAEKAYDGTALTRNNPVRDITVSGDGFVSGEEPMYKIIGSQTEVGSSENAFEYFTSTGVSSSAFDLFKAEEKGFNNDNYNITKVYGMLTVTEAPAPTPTPGGGNNPPAGGGGNPAGGGGNPAVAGPAIPAQTIADNPGPTTIGDGAAPKTLAAYWALINLICAILTAILSIIMLIRYFTRRKEEDEETGEEEKVQRKGKLRIASIIPAIGAIIAFILTEDITLPMQLIDKWTVLMIVILAIQVLVAIFANFRRDDDDEEEEAEAAA